MVVGLLFEGGGEAGWRGSGIGRDPLLEPGAEGASRSEWELGGLLGLWFLLD